MDADDSLSTGSVLFVDLVGYSLWPAQVQARRVGALLDHVRNCEAVREEETRGALLKVPSGDGVALVFERPDTALRAAISLRESLRTTPDLSARFGLHAGQIASLVDINGAKTAAGDGINGAKRVLDCARPGEILLSATLANLLSETERANLRDRGTFPTKHGASLHLFATDDPQAGQFPGASGGDDTIAAGGGLSPDAETYVPRAVDDDFVRALSRGDAIVLVQGPRQVGKTSLLARGLQRARAGNVRVAVVDLQSFTAAQLQTPETVCRALADSLADSLDTDDPAAHFRPDRAPNANLERYLRRVALAGETRLIWAIDEADRLFPRPFASDLFGLFRSWHNRRALEPDGPWRRLTLVLAHAVEAHLYLTDPNQSPFNVGTRLALFDFTVEQVEDLNRRCGSPLDVSAVPRLHALTGGQPFLCRRALQEAESGADIERIERLSLTDDGPFAEHLRRILLSVTQETELTDAVKATLAGQPVSSTTIFLRLRAAGVLSGESARTPRLRSPLYARYLAVHLAQG